jgi:DNA replication protein DnaC
LIVGEPGTGKTALAIAISKSVGEDTPFVSLSASEVFSVDIRYNHINVDYIQFNYIVIISNLARRKRSLRLFVRPSASVFVRRRRFFSEFFLK